MINRRLLRIKVFKILFGRIYAGRESYQAAEKELLLSCEKTLDLLYFLLMLPYELKKQAVDKIEIGKSKYHPTPEEANPNMRFVENRVSEMLSENRELIDYCTKRGLVWASYKPFVKSLLTSLYSKDYFKEYMSSENCDFNSDKALIISFFREELEDNDALYEILEDMNIYWADDIAYVADIIIKMLSHLKPSGKLKFPEIFLQEEDKEYALRLLTHSMLHYDDYVSLLAKYVHNWEPERLASTDTCLIVMGISEAVSFSSIPIKVTINEFVEISKYYSTQNSKVFVNGILEKVLFGLKEEGKIEKKGRGLVGSID